MILNRGRLSVSLSVTRATIRDADGPTMLSLLRYCSQLLLLMVINVVVVVAALFVGKFLFDEQANKANTYIIHWDGSIIRAD